MWNLHKYFPEIPKQEGYHFVGNCILHFVMDNDERKKWCKKYWTMFSMRQQALIILVTSHGGGSKFFWVLWICFSGSELSKMKKRTRAKCARAFSHSVNLLLVAEVVTHFKFLLIWVCNLLEVEKNWIVTPSLLSNFQNFVEFIQNCRISERNSTGEELISPPPPVFLTWM